MVKKKNPENKIKEANAMLNRRQEHINYLNEQLSAKDDKIKELKNSVDTWKRAAQNVKYLVDIKQKLLEEVDKWNMWGLDDFRSMEDFYFIQEKLKKLRASINKIFDKERK